MSYQQTLLSHRSPLSAARPLLLGSASPRRRELLLAAGVPCDVRAPEVDEMLAAGETPDAYLARVVSAKLGAALVLVESHHGAVLVADTSVVVDGEVLGKPSDDEQARKMLRQLAGRTHQVSTRFALCALAGTTGAAGLVPETKSETVTTEVRVRSLSSSAIAAYVALGEGRDKAGSYAIQGRFGAAVESIEGSYANVVGLPLARVVLCLEQMGLFSLFGQG